MSESSPYSLHVVGTGDEPRHYELRDVSGRVVCKALMCAGDLFIVGVGGYSTSNRPMGFPVPSAMLEDLMRRMVR